MVIRTIFFDYDGVLTTDKSGSLTTFRYLSKASGIALSTLNAAFGPYAGELLMGRASYSQVWDRVCEAMGESLDIGLLVEAFESTPLNTGMLSLARRLRDAHAVGIITDNDSDRMGHLRKYQGLDALFRPIVVSADVGGSKRGQDIFRYAACSAGAAPDECIFIDNSRDNVAMALTLGMHAVFHDDERNDIDVLVNALQQRGARVGGN